MAAGENQTPVISPILKDDFAADGPVGDARKVGAGEGWSKITSRSWAGNLQVLNHQLVVTTTNDSEGHIAGLRGEKPVTHAGGMAFSALASGDSTAKDAYGADIGFATTGLPVDFSMFLATVRLNNSDVGIRLPGGGYAAIYPGVIKADTRYQCRVRMTGNSVIYEIRGGIFDQFGATVGNDNQLWWPVAEIEETLPGDLFPVMTATTKTAVMKFASALETTGATASDDAQIFDFRPDLHVNSAVHCPMLLPDKHGGLWAVWENGASHFAPDMVIKAKYRDPAGKWSPTQTLFPAPGPGRALNMANLSLVNGQVWLTYATTSDAFKTSSSICYHVLTADKEGNITAGPQQSYHWSAPNTDNYIQPNCPIYQLTRGPHKGRLLFSYFASRNLGRVARSDDNGATWQISEGISNINEATIVEEIDGTLVMYSRATGRVSRDVSLDDGVSWNPASRTFLPLPNPDSRVIARKLPDGSVLLIGQGNSKARNSIIAYQLGIHGAVLKTFPICEYPSTSIIAQYPDFNIHGKDLECVWSEANSIHWFSKKIDMGDPDNH